jgi:hypothetical protein
VSYIFAVHIEAVHEDCERLTAAVLGQREHCTPGFKKKRVFGNCKAVAMSVSSIFMVWHFND